METRPTVPESPPPGNVAKAAGWGSETGSVSGAGRFVPGQTVGGRYRIVSPLGRGGMGEVYRADDLELGVSVALKFLPASLTGDPTRLDRLRAEVRLARQVSHPSVCRVFDFVVPSETGGPGGHGHFISMEYVDGEDLATLLRRIGRVPHERAVALARQMCFGLAAAHDQGLIHRDLKPANIMIDGRGNARIMDFGVAALAGESRGPREIAAGTPAYMAPEQLAGREVSVRSDLFALGLVLYELFTGRAAYDRSGARTIDDLRALHESGSGPTRPSDHVPDVDPAVEAVILRCLSPDPSSRPPSALAVAAALPGGDPLDAALAAGELPSPELIARSGSRGRTAPWAAWAMAGMIALSLLAASWFRDARGMHRFVPFELEPAVLAAKARDTLNTLGVPREGTGEAWGFEVSRALLDAARSGAAGLTWDAVRAGDPPMMLFWYRRDATPVQPTLWFQRTILPVLPPLEPRSVLVAIGSAGTLVRFERVAPEAGLASEAPPAPDERAQRPATTPDWAPFFRAAGLDPSAFEPASPERAPRFGADTRFAWTGPHPNLSGAMLRVEAASLDGVPVLFRRIPPWQTPDAARGPAGGPVPPWIYRITGFLTLLALVSSALIARSNVLNRRSDRRGAFRLAVAVAAIEFVSLVIPRNRPADVITLEVIGRPLARAIYFGVLGWVLYLALEPIIRRAWPWLLVSWSRALAGQWKDPLVARHALAGAAVGVTTALPILPAQSWNAALGRFENPIWHDLSFHAGPLVSFSQTLATFNATIVVPLFLILLLVGVRRVTGRAWPGYLIITPVTLVTFFSGLLADPFTLAAAALSSLAITVVLMRLGLVAAVAAMFFAALTTNIPGTLDLSSWYAPLSGVYLLGAVGLAAAWARWASAGAPAPDPASALTPGRAVAP
ncbi:MAG: protein kinase [Phycisphaeraceae bacterium]|nr:MAG: protein kinase [Phycisphaeraceae bacterium]